MIHPTTRTLKRFADRELSSRSEARVTAHLRRCPRCRAEVTFLRDVKAGLPRIAIPTPPADAWDRIRGRLEAGERRILPLEVRGRRRPLAGRVAAVAAGLFMIGFAALFVLSTPEAGAHRSELRFFPDAPRSGDRVVVEYRPGAALGDEERLRLRARFRTPGDPSYTDRLRQTEVAELRRMRNGRFRGEFILPDDVVYAAFAVESIDGLVVDSNDRRLWEILVHGEAGVPLRDALQQRVEDLMGRNWTVAFETVRELNRLYPADPSGLSKLVIFHGWLHGQQAADSLRDELRPRLQDLHSNLAADPDVTPALMHGMLELAVAVAFRGEEHTYWLERLLRTEAPDHPIALASRSQRIVFGTTDEAELFEEMEELWSDMEPVAGPHLTLPMIQGYQAAQRLGNSAAYLRWIERDVEYGQAGVATRGMFARQLALNWPDLREQGMAWIRRELRRLDEVRPEDRALELDVESQRRENGPIARELLAAHGHALLAARRTAEALDTLALAIAEGWDPELFRAVGGAHLELGDTAAAARLFAYVVVDPETPPASADSLRQVAAVESDEQWRDLISQAEAAMRERVLAGSVSWPLSGRVRVVGIDGQTHALTELVQGRPTILAFWSRHCAISTMQLPALVRIAERLEEAGARVLLIGAEGFAAESLAHLEEASIDLPHYHDPDGDLRNILAVWGTPRYVVLDHTGRVRFERSDLGELRRQVKVLERGE
jgi:hypothetical protein